MRHASLTIKTKLLLVLGLLGTLLLAVTAGAWIGTRTMHASIRTLYDDRVVPLRDLKVVADLYAVNIVDTSHKVRNGSMTAEDGVRNLDAAKAGVSERWRAYMATYMDGAERALAADAQRVMRNADAAVERLRDLIRNEERTGLATFTATELYTAIDPVSEAVGKLVDLQIEEAKREASRADDTYSSLRIALSLASALAVLGLAWAAWTVVSGVSRPLGRISGQMTALSRGDLEVVVTEAGKRDEVGALARALEVFRDALVAKKAADTAAAAENETKMRRAQRLDELTRRFEANVSSLTQGLSSAATEMEATAQSMTAIANQTTTQSIGVASAAEQTSANVQTVAAATEELSASVQEIASQVAQSSGIAARAVAMAQGTDATVQALSADAGRIGEVVALINTIAEQTNLLALNATIEAARAGEAGKGFAVVAAEVKALAGQTTRATEQISAQIDRIQGATSDTVRAVREIGVIIGEMASISTGVAAAVEEQGAATGEIARNVQQAAQGTQAVTGAILDVKHGAGETGAAAAQVLGAARELAQHSSSLGREVGSFLADVRTA